MDGGGVLYDTTDPFEIARLMEAVLDDPALEETILQSQDAALARLLARDFAGTLLRFVEEIIAGPPRQAPAVTWDFWAQFEQFERFEELRQFRPAVFQALPEDPDGARRSALGARDRDRATSRAGNASHIADSRTNERWAPNAERRE